MTASIAAAPASLPYRFPPGPLRMEGTYRSDCVILSLENSRVREMIMPGLELGAQTLTPPARHPVLFMFGHHRGVRPTFLRIRGGSYHELVAAVPFLERAGADRRPAGLYSGPVSHMPRLELDSWLWVILGWFYGYPKVRARIRTVPEPISPLSSGPESYAVASLLAATPVVSAIFTPRGDAGPPRDFPFFEPVASVFRQPFISRVLGFPICSVMTFDLDRAVLRAIDARVDVRRPFVPGLPAGEFGASGIDTSSLGAFRIEVPWTLSFPFGWGSLKGAAS